MQLLGKKALVTGGGQGIGRGVVGRFLDEGARVAVVQRRSLDPELQGRSSVFGIHADLADTAVLPAVVDQVVDRLGGVDILVNNAGIMFERSVAEITPAEWDSMIALNLRAPLFLAQAVLPQFRKAGGGSIINIGSIEGIAANPQHAAYAASKAGIHGMTRALALDLGVDNVRCNAIAPGWIASELSETYLASQPAPAEARDALKRLHPVGRIGEPRDVGDLAVFLAGDNSGFLTGEVITLDGGRTARLPLPF
ncbi:SDR family NAD(P)-dependent oxidoreductase [Arthrobacter sp. RT-1]|jgi:NAD(P)-dependent dehydrogenase (short-subunit alcohol dehydrogenase family)|uniref:SDR family NAD(P)-dependent oxidoreductase n=1 Tax=Arthrobacter sp. RT-1 TaxID=2292263 RepID=UPI000E1EC8DA|nr:glucose 1-dehydrogenase [Arthrobacter sp. RT-1]RDV12531.1 SDR family NAD(P)-dependent oxidoreductase [Arthrobacter sp. RT-1]